MACEEGQRAASAPDEHMPVTWSIRGLVFVLSVVDVVSNQEIEQAFADAVASAPRARGLRLLWDASASLTPVSSSDIAWRFELVSSLAERGILVRVALLVRNEQRLILDLFRAQLQQAIPSIHSGVFTESAEALTWLES
jgi:hypothetical protein